MINTRGWTEIIHFFFICYIKNGLLRCYLYRTFDLSPKIPDRRGLHTNQSGGGLCAPFLSFTALLSLQLLTNKAILAGELSALQC